MKEMWTFNKKKSRLLAGFMALVLVFSNIAANVQTVYATGIATPSNGTLLQFPGQNNDDTAEPDLTQGPEETEPSEGLVLDILPRAEFDEEAGRYVWSGGWDTYKYSDQEGVTLGQVLLQDSEYSTLAEELTGTWSSDNTDVLAMYDDGDALVKSIGRATVTFTYEAPMAEPEAVTDEAAETPADTVATETEQSEDEAAVKGEAVVDEAEQSGDEADAEGEAIVDEAEQSGDEADAEGEAIVDETERSGDEADAEGEAIVDEAQPANEENAGDETGDSGEETVGEATPQNADKAEEPSVDAAEDTTPSETETAPRTTEAPADEQNVSEPEENDEPAAAEDAENEYPMEDGTELSWLVRVESSRVTVYSDEPYNDVMQLAVEAGYENPNFGESHIEAMAEEPPYGVNVTLPTDGVWKSLDENVISLTADGGMTVKVDNGVCQIAYGYVDESGEVAVAMWDVVIGVGIAPLNVRAQSRTTSKGNKYSYYPAPTQTGSAREPNANDLKSDGTGEYKFVLPNSNSKRLHLVSPFYLSSSRSSNGTVAMIYRLYNKTAQNYVYVYCADAGITATGGSSSQCAYRRDNLENSWFAAGKTQHELNKLRAVVENSYPYISNITDIIDPMVDAGYTIQGAVDLGQIISATQSAIWSITNGERRTFKRIVPTTNLDSYARRGEKRFGTVTAEYNTNTSQVSYNIEQIQNYLLSRTASSSSPDVVIRSMTADYAGKGGSYTIRVGLNAKVASGSDITVTIKKGNTTRGTKKLNAGDQYAVFENVTGINSGDTITATLSGTQSVKNAVYYYTPKDKTKSQALIGIGKGQAPVSASKDIKITNTELTLSLTKYEKLNGTETTTPVNGAEFRLYRKGKNGTADTLVASGLTSDTNGVVSYTFKVNNGADASEFYFVETKAPDGYEAADRTTKYSNNAKVYNEKKVGNLTVKKTVQNGTGIADTTKPFQFHVTIGGDTYEFSLAHDGSWTSPKDYPVGTSYTITEDSYGGYTASGLVGGTIQAGGSTVNVTNTYNVNSVSTDLKVKKTVLYGGYEQPEEQTFTFSLNGPSDVTYPPTTSVTTNGTDDALFSGITFTKAGDYTFTITEQNDNLHYIYDPSVWTVNVVVSDDGNGNLRVDSKTYTKDGVSNSDAAAFTNTYQPRPTTYTPTVSKNVTGGHERPLAKEFTFTLAEAETDNPKVLTDSMSATVEVPAGNGVGPFTGSFDEITFSKPGTYNFNITEDSGDEKGYTYDTNTSRLTVTVTDDHKGTLITAISFDGGDGAEFTNTYAPESATWAPSVTKQFNGDEDPKKTERVFTFDLSLTSGNAADVEIPDTKAVVSNSNDWNDTFREVKFKKAGTYTFQIAEENPNLAGYVGGVAAVQDITVVVKDVDGQLTTYADNEGTLVVSGFTFTNTFDYVDTYWTPSVEKTMDTNGHDIPEGYEQTFSFTLTQTEGPDGVAEVVEEPQTVELKVTPEEGKTFKNGPVSGTKSFDTVTFKEPGTYKFTISEVRGDTDPTGYTYDTTEYIVTVVVEDVAAKDGNLQKTVTVEKKVGRFTAGGPAAADDTAYTFEFTNTYKPVPTEVVLDVKKHIDAAAEQGGYTYPEDTTFTFVLEKDLGSSGRFSMGEVLENQAVTLEANDTKPGVEAGTTEGSVSFAPLKYEKAGTYKYRIREERGDTAGFTYDSTIWLVTVEVTDNKGRLGAAVTYRNGDSTNDAAEFTNKYDTTEVSYAPQITKVIEGSETAREKEFVFSLEAVQAENGRFTMGEVIGTARLQLKAGEALGYASFEEITYNKPGTYKYLIKEVKPDDAAENYKGYTFDGTVWTLVVEVVDTGNALKVDSATYTAGTEKSTESAKFTNQYHVTETKLNAGIKKTVEGDDRPAGQEYKFLFDITQADDQKGATLPDETEITVVIRSDEGSENSGRFGDITFTAAGTYTFEIAEKDNGIPGYTYDTEPFEMTVEVVDNDSQLEVTDVSFTKGGQEVTVEPMTNEIDNTKQFETVFTNVYTVVPVEYAPKVTKEVTGEIRPEHKYFHFTLEAAEDYGDSLTMPEKTTAEVLGTANGSVTTDSFGEITFNKAGTYEFRIEETNDSLPGYTYDKNVWTLTLVVSDHASELKVDSITYATKDTVTNEDITLVGETAAAEFVNDYQVKPTVYGPEVVKTITGMPLWDETFEFELTASADNTEGGAEFSGAESARKVTVTGAGTAKFDDITFKKAGTYTFTVKETAGNSPYWTYDDRSWTLTVVVEDEDSQLVVKSHSYTSNRPTPDTSETAAEFENGFTAPGELRISKTVTGNAGEVRRDFHFTVTLTDQSGNPLKGSYSYTGSSIYGSEDAPADGVITDGVVTVTLRHGQEITFHDIPAGAGYRVEEIEADTDGYRTTLTLNGNGQAAVVAEGTIQIEGTSVVEYENYRYQPTGGTTPDRPGTNIPDNEVPQSPGTPEIITISDEPTPLSNFETIEDEDVPLAFLAPMTGDNKPVGAAALFGLLALGMMGAFGILASKKDEEDA